MPKSRQIHRSGCRFFISQYIGRDASEKSITLVSVKTFCSKEQKTQMKGAPRSVETVAQSSAPDNSNALFAALRLRRRRQREMRAPGLTTRRCDSPGQFSIDRT